jgi:6-phosphogluconate dehydrogenase
MNVRLIGLGKMGLNIALNLIEHGYQVYGYDHDKKALERAWKQGIVTAESLAELAAFASKKPAVYWLMIPSEFMDSLIEEVLPLLKPTDVLIDAGNSHYGLSIRRYHNLKSKGVDFIDVGTSGGVEGARQGACLMVGGEPEVVKRLESLFFDLSTEDGYAYVGRPGSGHFVKMVHNGIEYGMMQAIGEGFDLLKASPFEIDYQAIAKVWNHGSIIASSLMGHVGQAFAKDHDLASIQGRVDDSGEGLWMVQDGLKYKVALPVITQALYARFKSNDEKRFSEKVVAAMRQEFGGHSVYKKT